MEIQLGVEEELGSKVNDHIAGPRVPRLGLGGCDKQPRACSGPGFTEERSAGRTGEL